MVSKEEPNARRAFGLFAAARRERDRQNGWNQRDVVCALVYVWTLITNRVGCERLEAVRLCSGAFIPRVPLAAEHTCTAFQAYKLIGECDERPNMYTVAPRCSSSNAYRASSNHSFDKSQSVAEALVVSFFEILNIVTLCTMDSQLACFGAGACQTLCCRVFAIRSASLILFAQVTLSYLCSWSIAYCYDPYDS
jgi:hypothetical protein